MKYLNRYNESTDDRQTQIMSYNEIIGQILKYKSDIIKRVNFLYKSSTPEVKHIEFSFKITYVDNTSSILSIITDHRIKLEYFEFFLDGKSIIDLYRSKGRSNFKLSDWISIFKLIEIRYNEISKEKIVSDMFKVITKEVIIENLGELLDIGEYSIQKHTENSKETYWKIGIKTSFKRLGTDDSSIIFDKDYVDALDSLIAATGRFKDLFDISIATRLSGPWFVIYIVANDKSGKTITLD